MNKRIFLSVLLPFCFFEIAKCSDVILVNLCGQEVKVVYNSLKSKAMDGEALTLRNVAVKNSETIFIAPVSRFRFHEKERYATMALNAENDHIILIDGFPEDEPTIVNYRVKTFSQGSKSFQELLAGIKNIHEVIKQRSRDIYERVRKGVVAVKKKGKLLGFRLRGVSRKELGLWNKELQKYKNDIKFVEKKIVELFSMSDKQQSDFKNSFYFDLRIKVNRLSETTKNVIGKLIS